MPQRLDESELGIVRYLVYLPSPVSIDTLGLVAGIRSVSALSLLEKLRKKGVVHEKRGYDKGIYFTHYAIAEKSLEEQLPENRPESTLKEVIAFYNKSLGESTERTLILAELYSKLNNIEEGLPHIKNAADILHRSGEIHKAVAYYDRILDHFEHKEPTKDTVVIFLESVLGGIFNTPEPRPVSKRMLVLERAEKVAEEHQQWTLLARIDSEFLMECIVAGQSKKATGCVDGFRKLAFRVRDPLMLRTAALFRAQLPFIRGRTLEATRCYEEEIGQLEEFSQDEIVLKTSTLIGWCYVISGRIARGMGMLDSIRAKAQLLNLPDVVLSADVLSIHALLEIRKMPEAEIILNKNKGVSLSSGNNLDHLLVWTLERFRAYLLYTNGDHEGSFDLHKQLVRYARSLGWALKETSWHLEYLDELELKGFINEEMSYETELELLIGGDDIYQKGLGLRYRALRNIRKQQPENTIMADLRKSEECLSRAGAEIELARTRIALGNYYLEKDDTTRAQSYIEKAWGVFSTVDKNLFPTDLMAIMPQEEKAEFMMGRIVDMTKFLGTIRDASSFLERAINIAMDFTMAMRGGFFVLENGEPRIIVSRNIDSTLFSTDYFRQIQQIILHTARAKTETVIPDPKKEYTDHEGPLRNAGITSLICMSAELGEQTYGYLLLSNRFGDTAPDYSMPLLRILCSQIAIGLSNIGMYNEMKDLKDRYEEEASFYKQEMGVAVPLETIIGESEAITRVKTRIRQVAPTDSFVLIGGETGVGKELIAKAIHNLSKRKDGPFIPINLAALPQDLVASELFGHEKGAFTGANEKLKGRFELADGGTIFLDEIGDLPQNVQVKLLRVLQEGTFERLGSSKPVRSDFRVIAATNKNLQTEVEKGSFRQDLFYRLNVFPVYAPPLRDHKGDIPSLADYFVDKYGRRLGKRIRRIPTDEMKKLFDYHWPGNVRELEHFIERAIIFSDGHGISFSGFEPRRNDGDPERGDSCTSSMANMEREYIIRVLEKNKWKIYGRNGAAKILDLKPTTLASRMKKLGIKKPGITNSGI